MYNYKKLPTSIPGLKFLPSIDPISDQKDYIKWEWNPPQEFSSLDIQLLEALMDQISHKTKCIVEIGVDRYKIDSSTQVFLDKKQEGCVYLGIDIDDKSYIDNPIKNIYTIQTDSKNKLEIFSKLDSIGAPPIDVLFIDGWHSIEMAINDWSYIERLSPDGIVVLHDVSFHPGPYCLFDAVDENLFHKDKYFSTREYNDFGLAIFQRIS